MPATPPVEANTPPRSADTKTGLDSGFGDGCNLRGILESESCALWPKAAALWGLFELSRSVKRSARLDRGSKYPTCEVLGPNTHTFMVFGARELNIGYLDPLGERATRSFELQALTWSYFPCRALLFYRPEAIQGPVPGHSAGHFGVSLSGMLSPHK